MSVVVTRMVMGQPPSGNRYSVLYCGKSKVAAPVVLFYILFLSTRKGKSPCRLILVPASLCVSTSSQPFYSCKDYSKYHVSYKNKADGKSRLKQQTYLQGYPKLMKYTTPFMLWGNQSLYFFLLENASVRYLPDD